MDTQRWAVIDTENQIVNVVVWDPSTEPHWTPGEGLLVAPLDDTRIIQPSGNAPADVVEIAAPADVIAESI